MTENKYKPTGRYVMAKETSTTSASGLVFESSESAYMEVEVLDVTQGWHESSGYVSAYLPFEAGDMLLVPRTAAQKVHVDGDDILVIRIDDIRAYKSIKSE